MSHGTPHAPYPLHAQLHASGASSGSLQATDDVPWIIGTRLAPGQKIRRSVLWGVAAYSVAFLHLVAAGVTIVQLEAMNPHAFNATLPVWGVLSLVLLASVIMCFIKRGTFNIVAGSIAACTLVISNPVIPLALISLFAG